MGCNLACQLSLSGSDSAGAGVGAPPAPPLDAFAQFER